MPTPRFAPTRTRPTHTLPKRSGARRWRSYPQARRYARTLGLTSAKAWGRHWKTHPRPADIPAAPDGVYTEEGTWVSWGHFLGTGTVATRTRTFREYAAAARWARKAGIRSVNQWRARVRAGKIPADIPRQPHQVYKKTKEWVTWGVFLGTGSVGPLDHDWRPFLKARAHLRRLGLRSHTEYTALRRRGKLPADFPAAPDAVYRHDGWRGWDDFLSTGRPAPGSRVWRRYGWARAWARRQRIATQREWLKLAQAGNLPPDIPRDPATAYGEAFTGWSDWLGATRFGDSSALERRIVTELAFLLGGRASGRKLPNGTGRPHRVDYANDERRLIVEFDGSVWHAPRLAEDRRKSATLRRLGWTVIRIRERPLAALHRHDVVVRANPTALLAVQAVLRQLIALEHGTAADRRSWRAYLSRKTLLSPPPTMRGWRDFSKARTYVRRLGLQNQQAWRAWAKTDARPADIPANPWEIYREYGWVDLGDWLGTGRRSNWGRQYLPYPKARAIVRRLKLSGRTAWQSYVKSGALPENIPASPRQVYGKRFTGWGDWLGTGNVPNWSHRFWPYPRARRYVHRLKLRNADQWRAFARSRLRPREIPSAPWDTYQGKGYTTLGDWLGTGRLRNGDAPRRPFPKARAWARTLGIPSGNQWRPHWKTRQRPTDIPANPVRAYAGKGWADWDDFLGTGRHRATKGGRTWRTYRQSSRWAQAQGIRTSTEWAQWSREGRLGRGIPGAPDALYAEEWVSWPTFLGTA